VGIVLGLEGAGAILALFIIVVPLENMFRRHDQKIHRPGLRTDLTYAMVSPALNIAQVVVGIAIALLMVPLWAPALLLRPLVMGQPGWLIVSLAETITVVCATHHAEELATLCHRVVVVDGGQPVFVGTPATLTEQAAGRVWEAGQPDPNAVSRAVGPGRFRCVAERIPPNTAAVVPTVADGYLATVRRS